MPDSQIRLRAGAYLYGLLQVLLGQAKTVDVASGHETSTRLVRELATEHAGCP